MKFSIVPNKKNKHPIRGMYIKSPDPNDWIQEIEKMRLDISNLRTYPIPGEIINSLWGCLLVFNKVPHEKGIRRNVYVQCVHDKLYIPMHSDVFPQLSANEMGSFFIKYQYAYHPDFGFVELTEAFEWKKYLKTKKKSISLQRKPEESIYLPKDIRTFKIQALPPELVIKKMEQSFPEREKRKDTPLNPVEKIKLIALRKIFSSVEKDGKSSVETTKLLKRFSSLLNLKDDEEWMEQLKKDYEDLERRNKKEVDKLMDMFKDNPMEALKYAIPLDTKGTARGPEVFGNFRLSKIWKRLGINETYHTYGKGVSMLGDDAYFRLRAQYQKTAQELKDQGEHQKAAFVYLKLLEDVNQAAKTLEDGGYFEEAGALYLKNKQKFEAAQCYEKGKIFEKAIQLYQQLEKHEKAGDLYVEIGKIEKAKEAYWLVVDNFKSRYNYIYASKILKNKIGDFDQAQLLLLSGWENNHQRLDCLKKYFSNLPYEELEASILHLQNTKRYGYDSSAFLKGIHHAYKDKEDIPISIKQSYCKILLEELENDHTTIVQLRDLYASDSTLVRDVFKYKTQKNKEKKAALATKQKDKDLTGMEEFKVEETMPKFPGCEHIQNEEDRKSCAQARMLEFIYNTLVYPEVAIKNGVQGTVVIRFIVDKNGEIIEPEIVRDIGAKCGEAALKVVKSMPKWNPGTQKGKAVKVQFNLPIKFSLS